MNIYLVVILFIIIGEYVLDLVVEGLNVRNVKTSLPIEFAGWYSADKYKKAQSYLKENTSFGLITKTILTAGILTFILTGSFNYIDRFARGFGFGPILTGLIFAGIIIIALGIINIPFSVYNTFVIEEKYGFNKTTPKTFILDILKSGVLTIIVGGIIFSAVLWFFGKTEAYAWVYCWVAVTLFQFFLMFIAPVVIMPLFNKFIPLEDGELKKSIEDYALRQNFKLKGIFKMDGSRRSVKSNAFFTGFGKYRRIVLFDTLIEKHTVAELVSVLAHEMGHFKKKHIFKHIAISVLTSGLMFFILSLLINNPGLFSAFKMEQLSIYASLFFFGFLYSPINMFFSIAGNILSRKYEYEADQYAVMTYKKRESMVSALKKLSVDNLSNLTPHPLKVFLEYSHPPVLERIKALK
ncbi:MAG: M48 family metallopeptidase [Candidatus Omnitrophota bacterium]|nr:M48 family metallopeptidase [Candidatus Omnitrophota bacterium]